ncbi:MAG: rod shape-determining protein MreC [Candidatus Paraprevotella stercoravium]|uniref:Cell shape-determining protein MreC n=2 Tax=Bacteroidales TaxID=171549 RepID=A0ABT7U3G1_9BACE|nr:rod shape-determining protein MreC [Candidatus Paraprevotella stercoravium]MDM8145057.1 rod shape-determining protein MreC [Bacteroides eggerthii]
MRKLLDFLSKYNYWLVFILLEAISLCALFRFNGYQGSVWFTSANTVSGKVMEWQSNILAYLALGDNNRALTERNVVLEHRIAELEHQLKKLDTEHSYTEQRTDSLLRSYQLLPATVVNNSVLLQDNYITINRGEADGVRPEMGVVCGTGVVGIIYLTAPHYSIVIPVLNSKSNISCRLRKSGYFGYLNWDGGNPLYAWMNDVPRYAKINTGDVIETSGFSSVFPEGLFIGKVNQVRNSKDGLSYRIKVHLGTDFARLRDVSVIISPDQNELDSLSVQLKEKSRK